MNSNTSKFFFGKNVFLPKLSILNELRRTALENVESLALANLHRNLPEDFVTKYGQKSKEDLILNHMRTFKKNKILGSQNSTPKISLLLNILHPDWDYSKLENIENIYIPLKYFTTKKYENVLKNISKKFSTYIYMPTIVKGNYKNLFYANADDAVNKYDIQGFVISNICNIRLLNSLFDNLNQSFKIIANYTFNVFNSQTILELKKLGVSKFTLSPELDRETLNHLCNYSYLQKELIVYGKTPLLNMNYCLLRRNR